MPLFYRDLRPDHLKDEQLRKQKPLPRWLVLILAVALGWGVVWPLLWALWRGVTWLWSRW